jgi:alpha-glucosidase
MVSTSLLAWPLLALANGSSGQTTLDNCPGYRASNVQERSTGLTADLTLAGEPCNTYGRDIEILKLRVDYEMGELYPFFV